MFVGNFQSAFRSPQSAIFWCPRQDLNPLLLVKSQVRCPLRHGGNSSRFWIPRRLALNPHSAFSNPQSFGAPGRTRTRSAWLKARYAACYATEAKLFRIADSQLRIETSVRNCQSAFRNPKSAIINGATGTRTRMSTMRRSRDSFTPSPHFVPFGGAEGRERRNRSVLYAPPMPLASSWLRRKDSNLHRRINSPACYRYTTSHPRDPSRIPNAAFQPQILPFARPALITDPCSLITDFLAHPRIRTELPGVQNQCIASMLDGHLHLRCACLFWSRKRESNPHDLVTSKAGGPPRTGSNPLSHFPLLCPLIPFAGAARGDRTLSCSVPGSRANHRHWSGS